MTMLVAAPSKLPNEPFRRACNPLQATRQTDSNGSSRGDLRKRRFGEANIDGTLDKLEKARRRVLESGAQRRPALEP